MVNIAPPPASRRKPTRRAPKKIQLHTIASCLRARTISKGWPVRMRCGTRPQFKPRHSDNFMRGFFFPGAHLMMPYRWCKCGELQPLPVGVFFWCEYPASIFGPQDIKDFKHGLDWVIHFLGFHPFVFSAVYIQIIYNQTPGQWELSKDIQTWVSLETQSRETELNNNEVSAKYTLEEGTVESDPNLPLYCQAGTWSVESKVTCEPKIVEKIFCGSVSNVFLLKFGLCVLWVEELCEK